MITDATLTSITSPLKVRGTKRNRDNDDVSVTDVWICEKVKIESILNRASRHDPTRYSPEEYDVMIQKLGVTQHFTADRVAKSNIKFRQK